MPSNITGLPHHSHPHHPHHHPSLLPSPSPPPPQQQCFQCRSIGGPLLMAATDHDDDNDDHMDHPNPSLKPRYAIELYGSMYPVIIQMIPFCSIVVVPRVS